MDPAAPLPTMTTSALTRSASTSLGEKTDSEARLGGFFVSFA